MTSPGLKEALASAENEATARQRLAFRRAGLPYQPPATHGQQLPWEGHPEDVLISTDSPVGMPRWAAALGWLALGALVLAAHATIWR